jgi:uncharacterized protein (TIGR00730 family)
MNITVYGAASENISEEYKGTCEEFGRELAKRGHTLIFGGGKNGLMGAVARGVTAEKGKSIGIAPKFFKPDGVFFEHCSEFILTEDMRSRKKLLEEKCDAIVVLPGGIGTFDEFFEVFTLNGLGQTHKPIALYNVKGYYTKLMDLINHAVSEGFLAKRIADTLLLSDKAEEIFKFLEK